MPWHFRLSLTTLQRNGETGILMGMGNPLLDISANVTQELLDKYDLKLDTAILAEDKHQPLYKELVNNYEVQYIAGGATQNSMRVAQWMLKDKKGMVAFMGCVGDDDYGRHLEECASKDGVCVHYMKDTTTPSGTCAALIVGGERSLVANLAAANNFKPSHLETEKAKEIVESAKFYVRRGNLTMQCTVKSLAHALPLSSVKYQYCAGFFLTVSVESLVQVAEHAIGSNKTFCLNLSAPFIIDFFGDQLATAMQYADYLFGNESEAATYGKKHGLGEDLAEIAKAVSALPKKNSSQPRTVVFTQGSKSTLVCVNGTVTEYAVEPLDKDKIVDTNGAGDAFVGGFLSQVVQGKGVEECVKAGHYAARYCIQQSGTSLDQACDYE
jgi:adenosine kinase